MAPPDGPEHSRPFETGSDHGFASGFDDARAHQEVLAAELGVAHALRISLEVVCLGANLLRDFGVAGFEGAGVSPAVARASCPRPLASRRGPRSTSLSKGRGRLRGGGSGTLPAHRARRPRYNLLGPVGKRCRKASTSVWRTPLTFALTFACFPNGGGWVYNLHIGDPKGNSRLDKSRMR